MTQWFESIDTNRDGLLDAKELQKALAMGNMKVMERTKLRPRWEVGGRLTKKPIQFSLATVAQMMRIHDSSRNNAGTITFADFTSLHMLLKSFSETFHRHDVNKAGRLNLQQVQQAVQAVGHTLDEAAFLAVSRSFDPNHTHDMGLPEFVALCSFLESARATFVAYDPQRTGIISLNYSQFCYCAAQTR